MKIKWLSVWVRFDVVFGAWSRTSQPPLIKRDDLRTALLCSGLKWLMHLNFSWGYSEQENSHTVFWNLKKKTLREVFHWNVVLINFRDVGDSVWEFSCSPSVGLWSSPMHLSLKRCAKVLLFIAHGQSQRHNQPNCQELMLALKAMSLPCVRTFSFCTFLKITQFGLFKMAMKWSDGHKNDLFETVDGDVVWTNCCPVSELSDQDVSHHDPLFPKTETLNIFCSSLIVTSHCEDGRRVKCLSSRFNPAGGCLM